MCVRVVLVRSSHEETPAPQPKDTSEAESAFISQKNREVIFGPFELGASDSTDKRTFTQGVS